MPVGDGERTPKIRAFTTISEKGSICLNLWSEEIYSCAWPGGGGGSIESTKDTIMCGGFIAMHQIRCLC